MNLNVSRITEVRDSHKSTANVVLELYKEQENYVSYDLIKTKITKRKLVFKNINHKNMLHKHLVFEHFYIALLLTLSICTYLLVVENYLMSILLLIGGVVLMLKLLNESEVPYKLVFDGLTIYELNHIGKRIMEFNPSIIENSDSNEYENNFIFMSSGNNGKMKSLIIMEGLEFGIRDILRMYFDDYSFTNHIKMRGQE